MKLFADVEAEDEDGANLSEVLEVLYSVWNSRFFQAGEVARLINAPMKGETAKADCLRSFFDTAGRKNTGTVSAISIGRRLGMIVDVPMVVGDVVMKLTKSQPNNQAGTSRPCRMLTFKPISATSLQRRSGLLRALRSPTNNGW